MERMKELNKEKAANKTGLYARISVSKDFLEKIPIHLKENYVKKKILNETTPKNV